MVKVIWHKTALPPLMDGSIKFARLRQCAPSSNLICMLLWAHPCPRPKWHLDQFSCFCTALYYTLQWATPFYPSNCPFTWGIWTPSTWWFFGSIQVHIPSDLSIDSAVFTRLTIVHTDRQTDHATPCVTIGRISTAIRKQRGWKVAVKSVYMCLWQVLFQLFVTIHFWRNIFLMSTFITIVINMKVTPIYFDLY